MKPILFILLLISAGPAWASVVCFNRAVTSTAPLKLTFALPKATAHFKHSACRLKQISYNPVSPKYQGWIRLGTPQGDCASLGREMFGLSEISKKPVRVYWISVSQEVQQGLKGFVQVGYENDVNPGHGPEAKLNMACFPEPSR